MKRLALYCLILLSSYSESKVWEFGNDIEDNEVLARYKSEGPLLEKFKRVDFYLPTCYFAMYVRAEVDNPVVKPKVSFDWEDNSLTFKYPAEKEGDKESVSSYNVVLKGKYQKKCKRSGKLNKGKIRPERSRPMVLMATLPWSEATYKHPWAVFMEHYYQDSY